MIVLNIFFQFCDPTGNHAGQPNHHPIALVGPNAQDQGVVRRQKFHHTIQDALTIATSAKIHRCKEGIEL
jgi:hypothetical protein